MSTTVTTERAAGMSPRLLARLVGLTALITTTAGFAQFVNGNLVVFGDAAATAHNILAHELLFRLAIVGDTISLLYIVYTLLVYYLLRPVSRSLAVLGALFSLVGIAVGAFIPLFEVAALVVLKNAQSFSGFNLEQVQSIALVCLQLRTQAYAISIVLFGTYDILTGYLIVRSTFMPRIFGVLWIIAGVGYLIYEFATFLAPDFAAHLTPWILIPGGADLLVPLWLLVFGVNVQRWKEQAALSR